MSDNKTCCVHRRVRNNHGSKLVTLPPDIARAAGIHFGDYVIVSFEKRGKKIVIRKYW